jgi:hypothetical protein
MLIASEASLRAQGEWPLGASHKHLSELVVLGRDQGWLTHAAVGEVTEVLNKVRTMAAHPGAYVRGIRSAPEDFDLRDIDGYPTCLDIVATATEQLKRAHEVSLGPAGFQ